MKARGTLLLLAAAAGLGVWVWWDLSRQGEGPMPFGPLLPELPQEQVTRAELEREEAGEGAATVRQKIVFEKREGAWRMIEPQEAPAEPQALNDLLSHPATQWCSHYVPAPEPERLGLGAAATRLTLFYPEGRAVVLIGRAPGYQQGVYAMVEGAPRAGLMEPGFDEPFRRPLERYLQKEGASRRLKENPESRIQNPDAAVP